MSRLPPFSRVGDFHILDFVGAGGMGEVFRAVHARTGQVAAAKFLSGASDLPPEARAKWRERFVHEARVQESLRHPNLAAFLEWHEVGATPCIVMELVDGQTLAALLQSGALSPSQALAIFQSVVEGVAFMHSRGVVHRDIKSSNIKINARGEVKLLDFGIAKTGDMARLTSTGAFVGTLQYLSPEQVKGKEADARCDVWALGALLYEMLCGSPPFEAPTWGELLEKVARAQFQPLSVRRADVPRELENIVRKCLQKQPSLRFADANELKSALEHIGTPGAATVKAAKPRGKVASNVPFFVAGGAGSVLLLALLLWPKSPVPAPPPTQNVAVATPSDPGVIESPTQLPLSSARPLSSINGGEGEMKTISINTLEGAGKTQVVCDGQALGFAPCEVRARLGQTLELSFSRPGFQTRRENLTVTASRSNYTFTLDPLP